ncbi:MAG: TfoX/Sxy family protein [Flavobacteriales bacterium]|jgi:TfoX/Sxy family transcriptional regulator of competence genes|nr:TfoX/Sxy family protein [Flavobacteriales bacterium]
MAFSEHLVERVRQRLQKANITDEKKMMGGLIFMVNDKMCIGVDKMKETGEDRLMVRVGKASHEQLLFKNGSQEMDFTGRVMRGFLFISPEGFDTEEDLDFWTDKALEFNQTV